MKLSLEQICIFKNIETFNVQIFQNGTKLFEGECKIANLKNDIKIADKTGCYLLIQAPLKSLTFIYIKL